VGTSVAESRSNHAALFLAVLAAACAAQVASALRPAWDYRATSGEALATASLASIFGGGEIVAMPYLAVPVLVAGVLRGVRGVLVVSGLEVAILIFGIPFTPDAGSGNYYSQVSVWLITSLGLGLLGSTIHKLVTATPGDESYRIAVRLIEQLHHVSARLTDGLDIGTIADNVLARARTFVPLETAALMRPEQNGSWRPLRFTGDNAADQLRDIAVHAEQARQENQPWSGDDALAAPLTRDGDVVAVLIGRGAAIDPARVAELDAALAGDTLRLDAALLFADITDSATREERQRLAREIHDGLAQDLASLGYLLDGVDVHAADADARVNGIREEITRVLQEVRHSVFGLRADVSATLSLSEGVSALAQHLRAHSPIRVHESIDGGRDRLRADVEAQLLRITQEAMNNARKHSGAANIWVRCHVDPPLAEIEVVDDGVGMGAPRDDSYGLQIMHERAERINASLDIDTRPDSARGTRVLVRVGQPKGRP